MDEDYIEIDSTPHEPTQEEIREYAKWLGADLSKDQDLFYIAREALLAKIPPGWKLYQKKDGYGDPFYFNVKTGESSWDHPLDQHYKDLFAAEKRKKSRGLTTKTQTATVSNRSNLGDLKPLGNLNSNTNNYPQSLLPNTNRSSNITTSNTATSFASLQQVNNLKSQIEDELEVIRRKGENDKADFQRKCENEIEEMRSNHRKKMESLRQQNDLESADLQKLTTQKKKQKDQLEDEIREMKRQFDKTKEETEDQQRKELRKLKNDHEAEIDNENKRFNKELSELKKSHQDTVNSEKSKISPSTLQADHDSEIEKLKAKFRDEINRLNQEHEEEVESLRKKHQSEIDDINEDHKRAIRQLKEKNQNEENQIKLSKASSNGAELSDLQADLESKKKAAIKKFEEEMEQLRSEQERKRKDLQKKSDDISLSKSNKKDSDTFALQQRIDDLEANKQHLEEQISKLKKSSSSSITFDQQQLNDLREEKEKLESSIAQLRQKKNTLSTSISSSQQQLDDLKDEKQQLEIEIDSIKRRKDSLQKEGDSISKGSLQPTSTALLEDEKQKLKERIEVLTSKFEAEKKRLQPNSREMLELQNQRDNYETEKAELESLRESVRQQRTKLQQRLSAKESAQLKSMQSDFDREKEEIEESIEELRNNLKREKLKNNSEMQKLKRNLDIEKERCQNELDTMKMNYRSQLEIAKSSYEREMANYQNKKSEIESDTAQLKDYYNEQKRRFNVSNLKQIELNYQQERDQIKRQHQEEIDKMNRKFRKEIDRIQQQNQFDANDDDENDNNGFSSRSKSHHKSKKSRDHHKLPVWLSYASFMQASVPPTSPSLATPKRKKVKSARSRLEINMPLSFTTPESNRYYLSLTSSFIANFAPINENNNNNNNFNATFYNGALSRAIPSQSVIFDEKIMQNLRKQKTKIERVQEQFETNYSSLNETIQISVGEVMNLCQGYKDLIAEQNRAINSLALDFQQQTAIMARNFRDKIYEMQNSHKIDMIQQQNKQAQQAYSMIAPQINHLNNYLPIQSCNDTDPRRRKKTFDDFDDSNDLERSVRMWKRK